MEIVKIRNCRVTVIPFVYNGVNLQDCEVEGRHSIHLPFKSYPHGEDGDSFFCCSYPGPMAKSRDEAIKRVISYAEHDGRLVGGVLIDKPHDQLSLIKPGVAKGFFRRGRVTCMSESPEESAWSLVVERTADAKLFQADMTVFGVDHLETRSHEAVKNYLLCKLLNVFWRIEEMAEANESVTGKYPGQFPIVKPSRSAFLVPAIRELSTVFAERYGMEIA